MVNGRERERYIADGRISNRAPQFVNGAPSDRPLSADELDRRGYDAAAKAIRAFEADWWEWSHYRRGREPRRV